MHGLRHEKTTSEFAKVGLEPQWPAPKMEAARERKDFQASDAIRDSLADAGVIVEDTTAGPRWTLAGNSLRTSPAGAGNDAHTPKGGL